MNSSFFNYLISFVVINLIIICAYIVIDFLTENKYKYIQLKVSARSYFINKEISINDYFFINTIKKIVFLILIYLFILIICFTFNFYFLNKYLFQNITKKEKIEIILEVVFSDIFVSAYLLTRIITRFVYLGKIISWRKINSKNKNKWKRFEDYLSISYLNDVIIFLTKEVNIESEFRKTHWKIRSCSKVKGLTRNNKKASEISLLFFILFTNKRNYQRNKINKKLCKHTQQANSLLIIHQFLFLYKKRSKNGCN